MGYTLTSPFPYIPKMTSGYGPRKIKLYGKYIYGFHRGQDYMVPVDTEARFARSTASGIAYKNYEKNGFGLYYYIKCDDGFGIIFAHLAAYAAPHKSTVKLNSIIGYCDSTGAATGSHLHLELHKKFGGGFTPKNAVPFKLLNR